MVYVVLLKFSANRQKAPEFMAGHNDWLSQGFERKLFLLAGSLQPSLGGAVLATGTSRAELEAFVRRDPFVAEGIVDAEVLEIDPKRFDSRLNSLLAASHG